MPTLYVRTRNGISTGFYENTPEAILYGIGQGNGAGPEFWLSHLVAMFFVLDKLTFGMLFSSPNGKIVHKSSGMSFVDDVTLVCTDEIPIINNDEILENDTHRDKRVCAQITKMTQHWEKMLFADGGRLDLKKLLLDTCLVEVDTRESSAEDKNRGTDEYDSGAVRKERKCSG